MGVSKGGVACVSARNVFGATPTYIEFLCTNDIICKSFHNISYSLELSHPARGSREAGIIFLSKKRGGREES